MKIYVVRKTTYGNDRYYPHCEIAKIFAALLGQDTLTPVNISYIKRLGYIVEVVPGGPTTL